MVAWFTGTLLTCSSNVHYLWLNHYGGNFDYFFTQASQMDRTREEKTGEYSNKNRLIVQQLTEAFTTYRENWMFILYLLKLIGQLIITVIGFIAAVFFFTDFDDVFYCPRNNATVSDEFWPRDEQVRCVFTSLRLFWVIRVADLILLGLVILCFFCGNKLLCGLERGEVQGHAFHRNIPIWQLLGHFPSEPIKSL